MKEIFERKNPMVSIIIPTYKRSQYLCRSIESILSQTYKNIEIIVVDDNGIGTEFQKNTYEQLQRYIEAEQITYIVHQVNKNGSAARNTGFRASKGEFVSFLDDDDYYKHDFVNESLNKLLESDEIWGGIFSPVTYVSRCGNGIVKKYITTYAKDCLTVEPFLTAKAHFNTSGILFRRSAIEHLKGFDESFRRHQDFEFMIRFFESYKLKVTSGKSLYYMDCTSEGNHGKDIPNRYEFEKDFLSRFKKELIHQGCLSSVSHFLYFQCTSSYLDKKIDKYFFKSFISSLKNGMFSFSEFKTLIKVLLKQVVIWY